ncbi:hypothetical protein EW093_04235 [Thiospirochaeta perfilievii]|uniref:Outer membrane protein beta-barrel domain-containing protein n=1 Tax=Thiospirochaeta perfilievii TaxID=252967 RepID=A0A5C1QA62_9SPIO|nr:hypothetical protein [Thiospirochaeta perfilievii]QEN03940.1 hypothetical protein EW093_04235 [Thiospirochaeta perfilievii]
MKKVLILALLTTLSVVVAVAETPQFFAFELGSGAAYNVDTGEVVTSNSMGFTYTFSEAFKGGFSFTEIDGISIDTINISIVPAENATLTMYTGSITTPAAGAVPAATELGFGVGLGYDFFTNTKSIFTSLGLYLDWFASNGGSYDIANGGVISMGLKTKIGL